MINIQEVKTAKQRREFLNFPLKLYKGNPCFAPPLYMDEKKLFRKDYVYYDQSEAVYYNAYKDGKMAGRISGILQKASNAKWGQKRVRFTRFDAINDGEVAAALFSAVEKWAKEKGMEEVVGPLGFSDLEREGLLVEGFDQPSTFEEQYNAEYYADLLSACGYEKEVDWVEFQLRLPENPDERVERLSKKVLEKYHLHFAEEKDTHKFLKRYHPEFFRILDETYEKIYGTVPFTDGMKKMMMDNFSLILDMRFVAMILDENDRAVCFGICFPSIAKAVQKSGGKLTPGTIFRILKAKKHPEVVDLGLIGVMPEYAMKGVSTAILAEVMRMLKEEGVQYVETNLNMEDNMNILNQWKVFNAFRNKRRRAYVKKI